MATNSGLTSVNCDTLSVDYTITLQDSNGTAGQVITSNGDDESVYWGTNSASTTHPLTAGANVSYASGNASWDGSIADTIVATNTTYTAGDGIQIGGTVIESKIDEDTIDYDGGGTMEVIKVPNALSAGTNLSYSSGSTFDGDAARTINLNSAPTNVNLTGIGNYVCPYLVFDVYDPSSVDTDSLSTSYVQIFSGNLSNSFTALTTEVEVQLQIFHAASTSNRWLYLRLSDGGGAEWSSGTTNGGYGTGTRNTERLVSYPDENDKRQMVMSWYLQGLTIGNSYTINPFAKTSSTWNYIYAGGSYPPCILKVINIRPTGV